MGGFVSSMHVNFLSASSWRIWKPSRATSEDLELRQKEHSKAVTDAILSGNLETLKRLCDESRYAFWASLDVLNAKSHLLHLAVSKNHLPIMMYLIDFGLDVDESDSSGMTALHVACKRNVSSCVQILLEKSRDMDKKDVWGRTPLIKALVYRNFDAAKLLLARGANPNAIDIYGMTPLTTAIDYNEMDMVHCLVSHGADLNLITHHPCRYSGPPLYLAVNNKNLAMVEELLVMGASTTARSQDYSNCTNKSVIAQCRNSNLQNNVVALALSELLNRGEDGALDNPAVMDVLMAVLAAHGGNLGPHLDVLVRVFTNARPRFFAMLIQKLHVCSSCCSEELSAAAMLHSTSTASSSHHHHQGGVVEHWAGRSLASANFDQLRQKFRSPPRLVSSLQNQARRKVRRSLMNSNHNIVWACHRLECPPALKSLILLKDIDRAFSHPSFCASPTKVTVAS